MTFQATTAAITLPAGTFSPNAAILLQLRRAPTGDWNTSTLAVTPYASGFVDEFGGLTDFAFSLAPNELILAIFTVFTVANIIVD